MLELYSIISGSSGNCSLVTDGQTNILVDCGTSGKRALASLHALGVEPERLNAIFVTHEHDDHIKGVGVLARKLKIPVYATYDTHSAMKIGKISEEQIRFVQPDAECAVGDIGITPISIPHDAADPCAYTFTDGSDRVTIATDLGTMTNELFSRLSGSRKIILESNHDIEMLRMGPYPYSLQRRILGNHGHLSNATAAETAYRLVETGTEHIMLGHLSEHNNIPELARMETTNYLSQHNIKVGCDVTLQVADRYEITCFAK